MATQSLKSFYENEGWKYSDEQSYDAHINENLTLVASEYVTNIRLRVLEKLGSGKNLLDIGCGPIQYPEYLEYSRNFELRVCIDLSEEALRLAKLKLREKGHYIVGDYFELINLNHAPFDGAALVNVLYHVEKNKQERFVRKILSDLSPGARLVVIYSNPRTLSAVLTKLSVLIKGFLVTIASQGKRVPGKNPIYFYRHPLSFWRNFQDLAEIEILSWRTFSPQLERVIFRKHFQGKFLLKLLFRLENFKWWARYAEYPMIVLTKHNLRKKDN